MKRPTRFFVGFAAAALTFGSLMATLGPQRFKSHHRGCYEHHCEAPANTATANTADTSH